MTDRLHTCPAPTLSSVGFRCGPLRPFPAISGAARLGSITFAHQLQPSDPLMIILLLLSGLHMVQAISSFTTIPQDVRLGL